MNHKQPFVLPFSAINKNDLPIVGGKGANLGEMTQAGFPAPPGFCVTTAAFEQFITASGQTEVLHASLDSIEANDLEATRRIGQQMVLPDVSGIMFTADPLTGERHITTIDASYGLGEALVAGLVSADLYKIDRRSYTVTEVQVADKQLAIRPLPDGGTVEQAISGAARTAQVLSNPQAIILAEIGDRIARHYGQPQDIEWTLTNGKFAILQSRPITSLFPIPEGALRTEEETGELQVMFSFASVQGVMEPITPLGQETARTLLSNTGKLFDMEVDNQSQRVAWTAAERLWLNFTALVRHPLGRKLIRAGLPWIDPIAAGALDTLWADPRVTPNPDWFKLSTVRRIGHFLGPLLGRLANIMRYPDANRDAYIREVESYFEEMRQQSEVSCTLARRMALFYGPDGIVASAFPFVLSRLLPFVVGGMASLNMLRMLSADLPPDVPNYLVLTRGLPHNVTTEMDMALWQTAQTIKGDAAATAVFNQQSAAELCQQYQDGTLPARGQTAVSQFMVQYGMRGLGEIDIGRPRWRENPTHILQVLQSYLQIEDPNLAPDMVFARGAAEAEAAIERLATAVRYTKGGPLKAKLVPILSYRLRALAGLREMPKFMIIRLLGLVREGLLKSGAELVAAGIIQQPDDLFYLYVDELNALAAGEKRDWIKLITERRARREREMGRKLIPRLLLSDGRAFYEGVGNGRETAVDGAAGTVTILDNGDKSP